MCCFHISQICSCFCMYVNCVIKHMFRWKIVIFRAVFPNLFHCQACNPLEVENLYGNPENIFFSVGLPPGMLFFSYSTSNFFHNGTLLQVMNKFPLEDQIQGCYIQALSLLPSSLRPRVDIQLLLTSVLILPRSKSGKKISCEKISP